jgi:large subunit ribosomal protein L23
MNRERIYQVLRSPHVSEKASVVGEAANQVVFKVASNATKHEIAEAVATLFEVKVIYVNTLRSKGKRKQFRGQNGIQSGFKKAYVTLAQGDDIDFLDGAAR